MTAPGYRGHIWFVAATTPSVNGGTILAVRLGFDLAHQYELLFSCQSDEQAAQVAQALREPAQRFISLRKGWSKDGQLTPELFAVALPTSTQGDDK